MSTNNPNNPNIQSMTEQTMPDGYKYFYYNNSTYEEIKNASEMELQTQLVNTISNLTVIPPYPTFDPKDFYTTGVSPNFYPTSVSPISEGGILSYQPLAYQPNNQPNGGLGWSIQSGNASGGLDVGVIYTPDPYKVHVLIQNEDGDIRLPTGDVYNVHTRELKKVSDNDSEPAKPEIKPEDILIIEIHGRRFKKIDKLELELETGPENEA